MANENQQYQLVLSAPPVSMTAGHDPMEILRHLIEDSTLDTIDSKLETFPSIIATSENLQDLEGLLSKLKAEGYAVLIVDQKHQSAEPELNLDDTLWEQPLLPDNRVTHHEDHSPLALDLTKVTEQTQEVQEEVIADNKISENNKAQQTWDLDLEMEQDSNLHLGPSVEIHNESSASEHKLENSLSFDDEIPGEKSQNTEEVHAIQKPSSPPPPPAPPALLQTTPQVDTSPTAGFTFSEETKVNVSIKDPPLEAQPNEQVSIEKARNEKTDNNETHMEEVSTPLVANESSILEANKEAKKRIRNKSKKIGDLTQIFAGIFIGGGLLYIVNSNFFSTTDNKPVNSNVVSEATTTNPEQSVTEETTAAHMPLSYTAHMDSPEIKLDLRTTVVGDILKGFGVSVTLPAPRELSVQEIVLGMRRAPWVQRANLDLEQVRINSDGSFLAEGAVRFSVEDISVKRLIGRGEVRGKFSEQRDKLNLSIKFQNGIIDKNDIRRFFVEQQPSTGYAIQLIYNQELDLNLETLPERK